MFPSPRWELVTLTARLFLNKIQLMSSRGHSKSTSVGKWRSWSTQKLTKSDIGWKRCNKKSDNTHSNFFYSQFSCFSVFPSVILDGAAIALQWTIIKTNPRLVICGSEKDVRLRYRSNHWEMFHGNGCS